MLTATIVRIIEFCTRHAWQVIVAGLVLAVVSGAYAARNFAITSDINALLSPNLEWRKRERSFEQAFGRFELIVLCLEIGIESAWRRAPACRALVGHWTGRRE